MRRARRAPKARKDGAGRLPGAAPESPLNSPFADLGKRMRLRPPPPPPPAPAPRRPVENVAEEPDLFARAMEGVRPLPRRTRLDGPMPASPPRPRVSEEAEALAELSDLVRGDAHFDVADTREY